MKSEHCLCDNCHENDAVCRWSLFGDDYGANLCSECCAKLDKEYSCKGVKKNKIKFVRFVNDFVLILLFVILVSFVCVMRDPNIDYWSIFEYNTICSLTLMSAMHWIMSKTFRHLAMNKIFYNLCVFVYNLFVVFSSAYIVFSDPYVFNSKKGVAFLIGVTVALLSIVALLIMKKMVLSGRRISVWVFCIVAFLGMLATYVPQIVWR